MMSSSLTTLTGAGNNNGSGSEDVPLALTSRSLQRHNINTNQQHLPPTTATMVSTTTTTTNNAATYRTNYDADYYSSPASPTNSNNRNLPPLSAQGVSPAAAVSTAPNKPILKNESRSSKSGPKRIYRNFGTTANSDNRNYNTTIAFDMSTKKNEASNVSSDSAASGYSGTGFDPRQQQQQQQQQTSGERSRLVFGGESQDSYGASFKRSATAESDAFQEFGDGRKRRHSRITAWEASWNINNSIQGMFVVGFPFAILEGGYWALIAIMGLGAVACYTGRILVDCLYEHDGMGNRLRVRRTYSEVAATCFGKRLGPSLVNFSQLAELLMTCVIYLVLCGDLFGDSFPQPDLTIYTWILISGILVLPYAFLHNIKHLAWISAACMAVHGVMMVAVLGYCLLHISEWQWSTVTFNCNIKNIALAVGLILSSNVAQIFLPLTEENMAEPRQFWPMLKWTFVAASIMKFLFAYIPFLTFGLETKEAITNNLPATGLKAIVNLILILKALLTYPLPYFTSVEILSDIFFASSDQVDSDAIFPSCYGDTVGGEARLKPWAILARAGLIIGTLLVALFVPHFSILMSFIGSFTGTMLALVWPCMFHLKLCRSQLSYWTIGFDVFLIVFGFVCCIVGMISSGIALSEKYE